ncbi:MAG: hypothetical protein ABIN66_02910 [candidate division WOR-3 bacterium]
MMSQNLHGIVRCYFTNRDEFHRFIIGLNPEQLAEALEELIALYAQDKNSSTLRELITLSIAGYRPHGGKLGFNGENEHGPAEVKPKNIESSSDNKLNGGGNFTDLTYQRFEKYLAANLTMLVSGFIDGNLIHVLGFPFGCSDFAEHLKAKLDKFFGGEHQPGKYLRSAEFSFRHYKNCKDLRVIYFNEELIDKYKDNISGDFLNFLIEKTRRQLNDTG